MQDTEFGKLLLSIGYITPEQLKVAQDVQIVQTCPLINILSSLAFVSPKEIAVATALSVKKEYIDIAEVTPSSTAFLQFNKETLKSHYFLPFDVTDTKIMVAVANPYDIEIIDILRSKTKLKPEIYISDKQSILRSIEIAFYLSNNTLEQEIRRTASSELSDVPTLLESIMKYAVTERATDIHISPEADGSHIFLRTDGVMRHCLVLTKETHNALVSRIKILSDLDIAEQRLPQDGSMSTSFFGEEYDIRVSTIPSAYGENIALRLLGKNLSLFSLENLGFENDTCNKLTKCFAKPHGIFLVTGPTGSGKTTTLYSALRKINALGKRILTAEDPIEYRFPFIKQTQVNEKAGYSFDSAMRAFLRQDPDVILLGEMRDDITAEIAMRAAITGHLVLSTMHANDAVTAIPRLLDLKIKNYLIASGLNAVMAQRLVRKLCPHCSLEYQADLEELSSLDSVIIEKLNITNDTIFRKATGCPKCRNTGYAGRTVISELLVNDKEIQDMIIKGATPNEIHKEAESKGMHSLESDGLRKALKGLTSLAEIKRVTG
jgi:type IV pilus assembly protein PilB